jgi:hypothetical protein
VKIDPELVKLKNPLLEAVVRELLIKTQLAGKRLSGC